jgi:N-acetylglucosamine-6-sulfatase
MKKIFFLSLIVLLSLIISRSVVAQEVNVEDEGPVVAGAENKPNIVILMLDDVNPMDGRFFKENRTPHIYNNIVSRGINFNNFYVETTLCCPARAGYLTGQHTQNHGVDDLDGTKFNPQVTLATETRAVGYYNIYTGKYLNRFRDFPANKKIPPGWDKFDAIHANNGKYYNYEIIHRNGTTDYYGDRASDYSTDVIANWTVKRIKEAPTNKPLMVVANPYSIHGPHIVAPRHIGDERCKYISKWKPPDYNEADRSDKALWIQNLSAFPADGYDIKTECEMLLSSDDLLGKIVAELKRQGRYQNTIFILTADNGYGFGEHRIPAKTSPYVTHVPLYISWAAGRGTTPRTDSTVLSNIDIAPTICEIAGCIMGPYPNGQTKPDGISFLSLIKNETKNFQRDAILASQPIKPDGAGPDTRSAWWAVRTTHDHPNGLWHYIEYNTGEKELYDMSGGLCYKWNSTKPGDPCELRNLLYHSPNDPTVIAMKNLLATRLHELKNEKGYTPPTPTLTPTLTPTPTVTLIPTLTLTPTFSPTTTPEL